MEELKLGPNGYGHMPSAFPFTLYFTIVFPLANPVGY